MFAMHGTCISRTPPPTPFPGHGSTSSQSGVSDGVREVQAQFDFDSVEECEHERARLDDLLRDKYGVFVSTHSSETLFGQPDERGIPRALRGSVDVRVHA